jgi:hypothetical protein
MTSYRTFQKVDAERGRLPPGVVDKAAVDVLAAAGAVAGALRVLPAGAGGSVSMAGDALKVGGDVSAGRAPEPAHVTSIVGRGAAMAAGGMIAGAAGADAGAVAFDAGVGVGNAVVKVAVDRYFERRDTEIMQRADAELYERYREVLRRRGVDIDGRPGQVPLPGLR